jgi:hypothetical protein
MPTLNFDPQGQGGIVIGNPSTGSGGFTSLSLSISAASGGRAEIQSISKSGSAWGDLSLNPNGGNVVLKLTPPPAGVATVDVVVDPTTGKLYRQG